MKFPLLLALAVPGLSLAQQGHLELGLQAWKQSSPEEHYLVVNYRNEPGWHTYWKNPGDAGLPLNNQFSVGDLLEELPWPVPQVFKDPTGLVGIGHSGEYSLFYLIKNEPLLRKAPFKLQASWLACKDICVPGKRVFEARWNGTTLSVPDSELHVPRAQLQERFKALPQKAPWPQLSISLSQKTPQAPLELVYSFSPSSRQQLKGQNLIIPIPTPALEFGREALTFEGTQARGTIPVSWEGAYMDPPQELPPNGVFTIPPTVEFLFYHPKEKSHFMVERTLTKIDRPTQTEEKKKPPS